MECRFRSTDTGASRRYTTLAVASSPLPYRRRRTTWYQPERDGVRTTQAAESVANKGEYQRTFKLYYFINANVF